MHTEQKVGSNWSLRQQNYLPVLLWGPLFVGGPCSTEHAEHA